MKQKEFEEFKAFLRRLFLEEAQNSYYNTDDALTKYRKQSEYISSCTHQMIGVLSEHKVNRNGKETIATYTGTQVVELYKLIDEIADEVFNKQERRNAL